MQGPERKQTQRGCRGLGCRNQLHSVRCIAPYIDLQIGGGETPASGAWSEFPEISERGLRSGSRLFIFSSGPCKVSLVMSRYFGIVPDTTSGLSCKITKPLMGELQDLAPKQMFSFLQSQRKNLQTNSCL